MLSIVRWKHTVTTFLHFVVLSADGESIPTVRYHRQLVLTSFWPIKMRLAQLLQQWLRTSSILVVAGTVTVVWLTGVNRQASQCQ